jgi:DNA ligase 1
MKNKSKLLYHKGKSGAIYSWRAWVEGDRVCTEYGLLNGKKQETFRTCEPKNVGKKNATTGETQALAELESLYTFQLDRKYSDTIVGAEEPQTFPMLAKDFQKEKKKIGYPVDVQPKLDCVRCLAFMEGDEVVLLSRSGKPYNVPHIKAQVKELFEKIGDVENFVLDGELYIHDQTFQTITSWVKKLRPETQRVEYWIYDVALNGVEWWERAQILSEVSNDIKDVGSRSLFVVDTRTANCEDEVMSLQGEFIAAGYEGAIVRTMDHTYRFGYRSSGLLKVKTFQDAEYEVVGYGAGEGSYRDCVIWTCIDKKTGKMFRVNPKGTFAEKREWMENGQDYVGQLLKVKYFELTDDGLPRFPVGIGFRMKEDM